MKKRAYRELSISLFDGEEELLGIVVSILSDGVTNLNLSMLTAKVITGKVKVKCQMCICVNPGTKNVKYEWSDDPYTNPKSRKFTGPNSWSGDQYLAAIADTTLYPDAVAIADELESSMFCSW